MSSAMSQRMFGFESAARAVKAMAGCEEGTDGGSWDDGWDEATGAGHKTRFRP